MVKISKDILQQVSQYCEEGYPHEVCGLLLGKCQTVEHVFSAKNLNQERAQDRYELDPADFQAADAAARQQALEIIGFYHSHPDHPADASQTDTERAWEGYIYLIVSVIKGKVEKYKAWRLNEGRMVEERVEV